MSTFLLTRGKGSMRRVAHFAKYDAFGQISGSWCGRSWNLSSNVPFARPRCKDCLRKMNQRSPA